MPLPDQVKKRGRPRKADTLKCRPIVSDTRQYVKKDLAFLKHKSLQKQKRLRKRKALCHRQSANKEDFKLNGKKRGRPSLAATNRNRMLLTNQKQKDANQTGRPTKKCLNSKPQFVEDVCDSPQPTALQQSKNKIAKKLAVKARLKSLRSAHADSKVSPASSVRTLRSRNAFKEEQESAALKKKKTEATNLLKKKQALSKIRKLEYEIPVINLAPVVELDKDDIVSSAWLPLGEHKPLSKEQRMLLRGCDPRHECCQQRAVEMVDNCTQWEDPVQLYRMLSASVASSVPPLPVAPDAGTAMACGQLILNQNLKTGQPLQAYTVIQQPPGQQQQLVVMQNAPGAGTNFHQTRYAFPQRGLEHNDLLVQQIQAVGGLGHQVFNKKLSAVKREEPFGAAKPVGKRRGRRRKSRAPTSSASLYQDKKPLSFPVYNPDTVGPQFERIPYVTDNNNVSQHLHGASYGEPKVGLPSQTDYYKHLTPGQTADPYLGLQSSSTFQQSKHDGLDLEPHDLEIEETDDPSQGFQFNFPSASSVKQHIESEVKEEQVPWEKRYKVGPPEAKKDTFLTPKPAFTELSILKTASHPMFISPVHHVASPAQFGPAQAGLIPKTSDKNVPALLIPLQAKSQSSQQTAPTLTQIPHHLKKIPQTTRKSIPASQGCPQPHISLIPTPVLQSLLNSTIDSQNKHRASFEIISRLAKQISGQPLTNSGGPQQNSSVAQMPPQQISSVAQMPPQQNSSVAQMPPQPNSSMAQIPLQQISSVAQMPPQQNSPVARMPPQLNSPVAQMPPLKASTSQPPEQLTPLTPNTTAKSTPQHSQPYGQIFDSTGSLLNQMNTITQQPVQTAPASQTPCQATSSSILEGAQQNASISQQGDSFSHSLSGTSMAQGPSYTSDNIAFNPTSSSGKCEESSLNYPSPDPVVSVVVLDSDSDVEG
ncbi:hypothetical protein PoB_000364100 [Plakobranchus ocellatus]|uniref:Uncharacterized protein n=1 Tax=Plakobranchus ocellatus TaxID=259542 RepID=A0AAV3XKF1_9GAST|nr:hypothetical protein PoB_000364100 [Plakobranchus ocellatus]